MDNDTNVDEPLIQNCPDCGAAMDVSEVEPLAAVVCPACGAPTTVSSMIDHFQLVDMLGHGGMGAVYKAHDTSLDRMVALKLLRKSSGTAEQIKQLETEAAITASINHPHVVRVFSTGIDHGRFYIAMELVEKGTLDRLIELQGRVAEAQVLEVGMQIASGLRAAQQAGLIHRDVKPGNILFTDAHTAKIVDFGLAIFAEDEAKVRGEIWGTPYYVAPEKLDQKPEDFRSDIYSLGGTLFHALAGRPPFEAENASLVALKHLKNQAVSLQAFAPHISSNTAYVINRTLNKDPDQRYQSYDELIEHFEYALNELQAGRGKAGEKRVVLETDEQKKAMGWLSFVMVGVLILLVGGGVLFRNRIFSGSPEEEAKKGSALVAQGISDLAGEKPAEAVTALAAVAAQKPKQPWLNWADMLTGLAQFATGHRPEGIEAFQRVVARGPFSKSEADQTLANFFVETARQMTSEHVIDAKTTKVAAGSFGPAAYLFYGMKDWEAGDVEEGAEFFRRFRQADFVGPESWLDGLKPLATDYVEEYTAYQMATDGWKGAKTLDQKRTALKALKAVQGKLAPKTQALAVTAAADIAKVEKDRTAMIAQGKVPDGRYKLTNRKTGKVIEVENHSRDDGHKLQTNTFNNGGHQQWHLIPEGNDYYMLVGMESGKAINVPTNPPTLNPPNTSNATKAPTSPTPKPATPTPTPAPKVVTDDGATVQQSNVNKTSSLQKWKLEKVEGDYFKLTSQNDGKVLAVAPNAPVASSTLIQTTYTNAQEQQWKIEGL
ncbi:MAG: protein kinase [Chthoniobacter sp.]|uniref:serine/threonine protein kinase n=1 Tax=Chthoniobacter sp. TaxID=2510640 RepID=UPI0032A44F17